MNTLAPNSNPKTKPVHIAVCVTGLLVLTLGATGQLFINSEMLFLTVLFYGPIILATWQLVLIGVKVFRISKATLPGLWILLLGLIMLAVGIPSWVLLLTKDTDWGYGFIVNILIVTPGIWVTLIGFVVLLTGIALDLIRRYMHNRG